eukprot:SAG11_NODE_7299_length_1165_cov_0.610694_1_plen_101_part_00
MAPDSALDVERFARTPTSDPMVLRVCQESAEYGYPPGQSNHWSERAVRLCPDCNDTVPFVAKLCHRCTTSTVNAQIASIGASVCPAILPWLGCLRKGKGG